MFLSNSIWTNPGIILLLLIATFGIIAFLVFLLRKFVINKKESDEKPKQEQAIQEDLDRFLEPVDDEDTKKQFEEYEKETNGEKKDK